MTSALGASRLSVKLELELRNDCINERLVLPGLLHDHIIKGSRHPLHYSTFSVASDGLRGNEY